MHSEQGLLPETLLADVQEMLEDVPYDIEARTDFQGKFVRLRMYHINPDSSRSGIAISLDPGLLWEHNKKGVQMAIDALVRHIERPDE